MSPDGTFDTPRMPVAEHRRQLGNVLFQLANGFGQVMRGVADAAGTFDTLADRAEAIAGAVGPMFDEAVDPRRDIRPDADGIFNPAFVDVPESLKQSARDHRRAVSISDVYEAWARCEWGHMAYVPLIGEKTMLARKADFTAALPHLGTKLVAYHASENFVCREYGFLSAVVTAELWANTGIVCDDTGHHLYCQPPVWSPDDDGTPFVEILVWEPQADIGEREYKPPPALPRDCVQPGELADDVEPTVVEYSWGNPLAGGPGPDWHQITIPPSRARGPA